MSDKEYNRQKRIIERWDRLLGKWSVRVSGLIFLTAAIIYFLFERG